RAQLRTSSSSSSTINTVSADFVNAGASIPSWTRELVSSVPIQERSAKIETVRIRAQPKEQRQRRAECRVSVRGYGRNEKEKMWAGGDVLSHPVARAVPSALRGLTAVFGMGTGVAPA